MSFCKVSNADLRSSRQSTTSRPRLSDRHGLSALWKGSFIPLSSRNPLRWHDTRASINFAFNRHLIYILDEFHMESKTDIVCLGPNTSVFQAISSNHYCSSWMTRWQAADSSLPSTSYVQRHHHPRHHQNTCTVTRETTTSGDSHRRGWDLSFNVVHDIILTM